MNVFAIARPKATIEATPASTTAAAIEIVKVIQPRTAPTTMTPKVMPVLTMTSS